MTLDLQAHVREILQGVSEKDYSGPYRDHALEIYKLFVEMADRISQRRDRANSFFLTLNTGLVGLAGYVSAEEIPGPPMALLALAGMVLSYLWFRILRSYRGINSAKFAVIHEIERQLPLRPYDAEWEAVGRGEDPERYRALTHIEGRVPWIFLFLYVAVLVWWAWSGGAFDAFTG